MIASARMAFPGMLMGLLLAGPILAAAPAAAATGPHSALPDSATANSSQTRSKQPRARQARASRGPVRHAEVRHIEARHADPRHIEVRHTASRAGRPAATISAAIDLAYDDPRAVAARAPLAPLADAQTGDSGWHQSGTASWYGGQRWQGHATSSGARYDQASFTAAHATLPLGTRVRVTVDGTGRSVVVVINDRPGTRTRIIDLSRSAAVELGILDSGVARVTLSRL